MSIISFNKEHNLCVLGFKLKKEFDPKTEMELFIDWLAEHKTTSAIIDVEIIGHNRYKSKYVDTVLLETTELEYEFLFSWEQITADVSKLPPDALYIICHNCTQEKWTPYVVMMGILADRLVEHNLIEDFRNKQENQYEYRYSKK